MDQIIKFGISNYLQLCVEAGFSQIQSHMRNVDYPSSKVIVLIDLQVTALMGVIKHYQID